MKRLVSITLLLVFLFQSLFCLEFQPYSGLTQLEDKLTSLEDNLLKQQSQITLLQGNLKIANQDLNNAILYSKNLETQLDEALKQSEIVSTSLKNKDITLRVLSITLTVAVPTSFIIGLMIGLNTRG